MSYADIAVPSPHGWENVADAIFHNARRRPAHPAIIDGARTIGYAELAGLVLRTAGHLEDMGARPGDIIGVALGDNADHIVALLAIAWLGAVILPMDVRWTAEEKRRLAMHFGARFVFPPTTTRSMASPRSRSTRPGTPPSRRTPAMAAVCGGVISRSFYRCLPAPPASPRGRWSRMAIR
jgi:non-ribosomal peptide synthetase component F